jgi:P4 family phage/plasmid primase-like protien
MASKSISFDEYIKQFIIGKGEAYTHTKIGNKEKGIGGGTYFIPGEEIANFHKRYCNHVFNNDNLAFLTEKQSIEDGPLLVDVDMRYETSVSTRQHTKEHIVDLVMLYANKILKIFKIPNETKIPVYILQKKDVNMLADTTKDGIHIIMGIKMHKAAQVMLREFVLKDFPEMWDDLPITNTFDDVLDLGVTKGFCNWQMYGSRKPCNKAYQLDTQYIIEYLEEEEDWTIEEVTKPFDMDKKFIELSAQNKTHSGFPVLANIEEKYEEAKAGLTKKASPKYKVINKSINLRDMDYSKIKNIETLDEYITHFIDTLNPVDYELKETHDFTQILPESYYGPGSYNKWIRVGWALKNTDEKLILSWLKFCSKSSEFKCDDISNLVEQWNAFDFDNEDGLTHRSIMFWAKLDALAEYNDVRKETTGYFVEQTLKSCADWDLANVLYQIYKDVFVCISIKNNIWYEYKKHRWYEIDSGTTLRLIISKQLHDIYMKKGVEVVDALKGVDQSDQQYDILRKRSNNITEICGMLKKSPSKNNIMREARELFYDRYFIDKLDQNPYLLCFNNYVIDFKMKEYRRGQPDDYISKCTHTDYVVASEPKFKALVAEITAFIEEIFPDKELKEYMWQHLASCLVGTNENQTFNIYTGSGCNGKSKLVELMSKGMGDYKATVPITLITQGRKAVGSTSSEVVQLKGVRYAVMQEPSKGDKINEGIMKEITGGDPLQGRALFQESVTFMPQFKLVVCTNTLFDIKSNDDGTWRRIRVCDFMSKFMDKPNEDPDKFPKENFPYQFKIDKKIDEKFTKWAPVFMSMLVSKAFETCGNVKDCKIVMARSDIYRDGQDYLSEFAKDKIVKRTDSKIKKTELLEEFKTWYTTQYGRASLPNGREITEYMDKRFGKCCSGKWFNVAILYDKDDEDDEF